MSLRAEPLRADGADAWAPEIAAGELKQKTARGLMTSSAAQGATIVLRTASLFILARLLLKEDFGLVNMVTAVTGLLALMRDAGLSIATVQWSSITRAQTSTLFWINLAIGAVLAVLATVIAPMLVSFYDEPRLFWLTVVLASTLLFNAVAAQHRAMLQRSMRFGVLGVIDVVSLIVGIGLAIGMASAGYGYWALAALWIGPVVLSAAGVWLATGWIPGMPRRCGVRPMVMFGGTITLNSLVVYAAYNLDKVLIGRVWGAEALGLYGRAYQLVNLPNENLNATIGSVAFPALSRVQHDPARLRSYFLKGYRLFLSLVTPLTVACAFFAEDIIRVALGPQWNDAAEIFRLLAPTILAFALANPFAWLMLATGRADRCLKIALVVTPALILAYALGVSHGAAAVAAGFSITMLLSVVPVVLWAKRGTLITLRDVVAAARPAFVSIGVGVVATLITRPMVEPVAPVLLRLFVESVVMAGPYLFTLLVIMKQKSVYTGLFRVAAG